LLYLSKAQAESHLDYSAIAYNLIVFQNNEVNTFKKNHSLSSPDLITGLNALFVGQVKNSDDEAYLYLIQSLVQIEKQNNPLAARYLILANTELEKKPSKNLNIIYTLTRANLNYKLGDYETCSELLGKIESPPNEIGFALDFLNASALWENKKNADAFNQFRLISIRHKKTSQTDDFFVYFNLSKLAEISGKSPEHLRYALIADSILTSAAIPQLHKSLSYNPSFKNGITEDVKFESAINVGIAYRKNGRYAFAITIFDQLLNAKKASNDSKALGKISTNKALTQTLDGQYTNAGQSYESAIKYYTQANELSHLSETYNLAAKNYYLNKEFSRAMNYTDMAVSASKENIDCENLATAAYIRYEIYLANNDPVKAQNNYFLYLNSRECVLEQQQEAQLSQKIKADQARALFNVSESQVLDEQRKNLELDNANILAEQKEKEVLLLKKENELKEIDIRNQQLEKEKIQRNLLILQNQLANELLQKKNDSYALELSQKDAEQKKKDAELKVLNSEKEIAKKDNEIKTKAIEIAKNKQQQSLYALLFLGLFIVLLSFLFFRIRRKNKIINSINEKIFLTNKELEATVNTVTEQGQIISIKNNEITESILYAKRLQESYLPDLKKFSSFFADHSLLYLPKEVISGDFYYLFQKGDTICMALADCTGHGVPGSMVASIGYQELSHLVENHDYEPGEILSSLNDRINGLLNTGHELGSDGMDLILLYLNPLTRTITYAGAKFNLLLQSNNELQEHKTDKISIGIRKESITFNTFKLSYLPNDILYLATDGFCDQMSKQTGKRIGNKKMNELIKEIGTLKLSDQTKRMTEFLNLHRSDGRQTDDITVMKFKLN
jgi:serine phosphatase RsbU (regulator of sigma subunit)